MVHVYHTNLDIGQVDMTAAWICLSPDERARAERFVFDKHRRRFVLGRYALRKLLAAHCGLLPEQLCFNYGRQGRPSLVGAPAAFDFNVSHSHHLVVVALARSMAVGIDVELIGMTGAAGAELGPTVLNADELKTLRRHPLARQDEQFLAYWTAKEAYMKLTGDGLSVAPQHIGVRWNDGSAQAGMGIADTGARAAKLTPVVIGADVMCTLATWHDIAEVVVEHRHLDAWLHAPIFPR